MKQEPKTTPQQKDELSRKDMQELIQLAAEQSVRAFLEARNSKIKSTSVKIGSWNVNGIRSKKIEVKQLLG